MIFGIDTLTEVNFKLKALEFKTNEMVPFGNLNSDLFFDMFMEAQKNSLEVLKVDRMDYFDFTNYLKDCHNLHHLSIGKGTKISSKLNLPNVKSLEIEYQRMNFLRAVPNIQELKINSTYDDPHSDIIKWGLFEKLKFLERLEIVDLPMDDFPIVPNLRSLTLHQMLHVDSEIFSRNPQIEELTFVLCYEITRRKSKVLKIIVGYLKKLRRLTIIDGTKVDPSAIVSI